MSIQKTIITILLLFLITACGETVSNKNLNENNKTENLIKKKIIGYLVDEPVINIDYHCGDKISKTDNQGKFECYSLPIKFIVGGIEIGSIHQLAKDLIVYPQDLVGVKRDDFGNQEVLKIASFLQSFNNIIPDNISFNSNKKLLSSIANILVLQRE